jgi:hypothetical protein
MHLMGSFVNSGRVFVKKLFPAFQINFKLLYFREMYLNAHLLLLHMLVEETFLDL